MEKETSCAVAPQKASNYDELFMHQTLLFADSLKDLRNIRKQLYSAADYFELTYGKDEHNHLEVEVLKDYVTKALVNTVDHLGTVAYKVNHFLDDKINEFSTTDLRLFRIEQRLRTCEGFIERGGLMQQSFQMRTPKYHKQYMIPARDGLNDVSNSKPIYEDELQLHRKGTMVKPLHAPFLRKGQSTSTRRSSIEPSSRPASFSFTRVTSIKEAGKRAVSPFRFSIMRSGSQANRSVTPNPTNGKQRSPSEPRRSISMCIYPERDSRSETEQHPKKSKPLLKALFSLNKSRKEGLPYKFRDDN